MKAANYAGIDGLMKSNTRLVNKRKTSSVLSKNKLDFIDSKGKVRGVTKDMDNSRESLMDHVHEFSLLGEGAKFVNPTLAVNMNGEEIKLSG